MERHREEVIAGALLGTFAGDTVGARWEGSRPAADGRDAAERIRRSLSRDELTYTDDTQLALALAEHLCDEPAVDPEGLAAVFLEHHEPWRGYGAGMIRLLEVWRRGTPVEEANTAIFPDGSFGNGAAMRVAPVGALWAAAVAADVAEAVELSLGVGGDADTIAAMAGAIAGAAGTVSDIPAVWLERFEDGARGRSYALDLARRLAEIPLG